MYWPAPVRKRWSSKRGKGLPIKVSMARIPPITGRIALQRRGQISLTGDRTKSPGPPTLSNFFSMVAASWLMSMKGGSCPGRAAAGKLSIGI